MDLLQAMKERHSVRSYDEKSIEAGTVEKLRSFIKECNKESGLHMQLVLDEPHAFEGFMAHYEIFRRQKLHCSYWPKEMIWKKSADIMGKRWFSMHRPWAEHLLGRTDLQ